MKDKNQMDRSNTKDAAELFADNNIKDLTSTFLTQLSANMKI